MIYYNNKNEVIFLVRYQLDVEYELWEKFKRKIPREENINDAIKKLIKKFVEEKK